MKRKATDLEKIFVIHRFDKGIVSRIYKELLQLNKTKMTQQKYWIKCDFPVSPVVRMWRFHCCGLDSIPGWGTKILQAAWCSQKKKKYWIKGLNRHFTEKKYMYVQ